MKESFQQAKHIAWMIAKLVIPFSILSEVLHYWGVIGYLGFLFEPATQLLNLPADVAIAFAAGFFLNIYAGIAVAAGLNLTPYEWTVVGTFIAICHSIPLESAVMKKVGFSIHIHWISRLLLGVLGAWVASVSTSPTLSPELVGHWAESAAAPEYAGVADLLISAVFNAITLTLKIVLLVTALVLMFDLIKRQSFFKKLLEKHTYLSSIVVGCLLGVTYGAGILLRDIESVAKEHKLYLLTFLLLAHGLIEETLIFALFGADVSAILFIRLGIACGAVLGLILITRTLNNNRTIRLQESND